MSREEMIRVLAWIQSVAFVDDDGEDLRAKLDRIYIAAGGVADRLRREAT